MTKYEMLKKAKKVFLHIKGVGWFRVNKNSCYRKFELLKSFEFDLREKENVLFIG